MRTIIILMALMATGCTQYVAIERAASGDRVSTIYVREAATGKCVKIYQYNNKVTTITVVDVVYCQGARP